MVLQQMLQAITTAQLLSSFFINYQTKDNELSSFCSSTHIFKPNKRPPKGIEACYPYSYNGRSNRIGGDDYQRVRGAWL